MFQDVKSGAKLRQFEKIITLWNFGWFINWLKNSNDKYV